MIKLIVIVLVSSMFLTCKSTENYTFRDKQLTYPRVQLAYREKDSQLQRLFEKQMFEYPPQNIYIRIFKDERILEVWTKTNSDATYKKVCEYEFCASSRKLGPKRQEGDLQIPEGFYYIDRFNPNSNFFLSLGINYPNKSDKILGVKGNLGGDIFIHGGCATVGCIPITDDKIMELYWLAVQAKSNGQENIPVHIFPSRLDKSFFNRLKDRFQDDVALLQFWSNLKIGYDWFVKHGNPPEITIDRQGIYHFSGSLQSCFIPNTILQGDEFSCFTTQSFPNPKYSLFYIMPYLIKFKHHTTDSLLFRRFCVLSADVSYPIKDG